MDDTENRAAARALSSPLRMRILRLCRFDARTNKELAELLEVNPGTMLHHVRTLVETGFLETQPERAGVRGAREVPYLATGRSWNAPMDQGVPILLETVRQQVLLADPERVEFGWLGLRLNEEHKAELSRAMHELFARYKDLPADPDGEAFSLSMILHPDLNPPAS